MTFLFLHHVLNILRAFLDNELHLDFLYENRMVQFGQLECLVFPKNFHFQSSFSKELPFLIYCPKCVLILPKSCSNCLIRLVQWQYKLANLYVRQGRKSSVSWQDLPRGNLTVEGGSDSSNNTTSSDDEEEETYVPSPQGQGKRVVGGSRGVSRAAEIEEEEEEEEGEEEVFDVDEIMPLSHVDMGALSFRIPQNPAWMEKVGYKGKTDAVREKRKQNQRLLPRDAYDYKFHTRF
jgi:hypothetical protein